MEHPQKAAAEAEAQGGRPLGMEPCKELIAGEVGYLTASIKNVKDTRVGDTVTEAQRPAQEALPGYRPAQAMVYCGIYTEDGRPSGGLWGPRWGRECGGPHPPAPIGC